MATEKEVISDWLQAFPLLKRYKSGRKLLRRFEFLVFGVELEKVRFDNEIYRPNFVALNLLASRPVFSLNLVLKNKDRSIYGVPYKKHEELFQDAVQLMKSQAPPFFENYIVAPNDVLLMYQEEMKRQINNGSSPLSSWISLIRIAGYLGNEELRDGEMRLMLDYVGKLPPESLTLYGDFKKFVNNEIYIDKREFEERMAANLVLLGF